MKVYELTDILNNLNPDIEIRLAQQPHWAFEYSIGYILATKVEGEQVVYIAEGIRLDYLPDDVFTKLGWKKCKAGPWFK
jgi:hypothetical protein